LRQRIVGVCRLGQVKYHPLGARVAHQDGREQWARRTAATYVTDGLADRRVSKQILAAGCGAVQVTGALVRDHGNLKGIGQGPNKSRRELGHVIVKESAPCAILAQVRPKRRGIVGGLKRHVARRQSRVEAIVENLHGEAILPHGHGVHRRAFLKARAERRKSVTIFGFVIIQQVKRRGRTQQPVQVGQVHGRRCIQIDFFAAEAGTAPSLMEPVGRKRVEAPRSGKMVDNNRAIEVESELQRLKIWRGKLLLQSGEQVEHADTSFVSEPGRVSRASRRDDGFILVARPM
jgi:hypothetical protein